MEFEKENAIILANEISKRGASTGFIINQCELTKRKAQAINKAANAERTKLSHEWYIKDATKNIHSNYLYNIYQSLKTTASREKKDELLFTIKIYDIYRTAVVKPVLNLERAHMLITYYSTGVLSSNQCSHCYNLFIVENLSMETICPACKFNTAFVCEDCHCILPLDRYVSYGNHLCNDCRLKRKARDEKKTYDKTFKYG